MNIKNVAVAIAFGAGMLGFTAGFAAAEVSGKTASGQSCTSKIELPQNKEELGLADVKHAVASHLLRIGAKNHQVQVKFDDEEIIVADISHRGRLMLRVKIDAVNAAIVERRNYGRAVGFDAPLVRNATGENDEFIQKVRYTRQLRRHMMGDGAAWANWIGSPDNGFNCRDDYRFGGPEMKEAGM